MFVPGIYQQDDPESQRAIIRDNPLAMLVSNGPDVPFATHLPAIIPPDAPSAGPLVGTTIIGHMNRANPHWKSLSDGQAGTLVFTGPNGYVSPVAYQTTPASPTWNFVAVHVTGTLSLLTEFEDTLRVVRQTVAFLEPKFGAGWEWVDSLEYFHQLGPGVGAFRVAVTSVDSMFKLSQEKSPDAQDRVMDHFAAKGNRDISTLMKAVGLGTAGHVLGPWADDKERWG